MANTSTDALAVPDLIVRITPRFFTRYYGTAAQLVAEGLIPDGFTWPEGDTSVSFAEGKFSHLVGRCRPEGLKGPMRLWLHGDHWCVQRSLLADQGTGGRGARIYAKIIELAETLYSGSAEWQHTRHLAYVAKQDAQYMAFRHRLQG